MLEKPDLPEARICACLQDVYGLGGMRVAFLPLGADRNTAVYRADAEDGAAYFVKLRRGEFHEISAALPKFLSSQGLAPILAPLSTRSGQTWTPLDDFKLILYPFVEGRDAYEGCLSEQQWTDFGTALNRIHTLKLPLLLSRRIPRETYAPIWRNKLRSFLALVDETQFRDPLAAALADFIKSHRASIIDLIRRADRSTRGLLERPPHFVLCHADIHAGNILIESSGAFYIVDWDDPIQAPKERDLMSIGAGLFGPWRSPQEEEVLFYRGYGETQINPEALVYYRYERIIDDLAVECEQIFLNGESGSDREREFQFFKSNFLPGNTIDLARSSDPAQEEA